MHLVIGNKLYSSWSLRAWITLKAFDIAFTETVIAMYKPDTRERMLAFGPTGKVPVLVDGDITVWESLAIIEYLADRFPDKAIWPANQAARAHARSAASEMHAGFTGIRSSCPMNLTKRFAPRDRGPEMAADIQRLQELWREARERFGGSGPFLYGEFSAADAMFAPVVSRLDTYQIDVDGETRRYMDAVLSYPSFVAWRDSALQEKWTLPHYEEGETAVEVFHFPETA
ncbi:glutathione S-transferase family protein [Oricola sp.]|uniref:glutathione S-transferase family protein n=1 Tax=Oricola sp. TaxID=1979950 RepID=UPI003BAB561E